MNKLYILSITSILIASFVLRFIDYNDRWGLAYDQSHDALVARHALTSFSLPLLGPFSSAGPFQTGGEWYWIIMLGTALYPFSVITPWVFMTFLYVLFVLLIIFVAKELVDEPFALFVGALAAVSPAQISQAVNLTNQTPQAIFSLMSILLAIRFLRTKKLKYIFWLAFCISFAASVHLQGAALISLLLFTFVLHGLPNLQMFVLAFFGLALPWLPVLIVDIQNDFYNVKNMIQYYLHDQYKISLDVLGRRWLTYAGEFWPRTWGFIVGGYSYFGFLSIVSVALMTGYAFWKRKMGKEWIVLLVSFTCMVTILRYTRTPLFASYTVFLHPFILLFTGWIVYLCYKKYKVVGIAVLFAFVIGSMHRNIYEIHAATNFTAIEAKIWRKTLTEKFPGERFIVYDLKDKTKDKSFSLVLFLDEDGKVDVQGHRIGLVATDAAMIRYQTITGKDEYIKIVDLENVSVDTLEKEGWNSVTPERVYKDTEEWYK